ncbi:MAG: hypothetical protein AB4062_00910 [Crocosphaera sp.]
MNYRRLFTNIGVGALIAIPMMLTNTEGVKAERRELMIHNHTGTDIAWLQIYPSWARNYRRSRVRYGKSGFVYLKTGDSIRVTLSGSSCDYDIIGRDSNGNNVPVGGVADFDTCENRRIGLTYISINTIPGLTARR